MARVLVVNERSGSLGGVEQNIADTVDGLNERGHTFFLAYGQQTDRDSQAYEARFEACYPCVSLQPEPSEHTGRSFEDILKETQPEVVYLHKTPNIAFVLQAAGRIPVVRMVHDHDLCCPRRHKYLVSNGRICHHKADWRCYLDLAFIERDRLSRLGVRWTGIRPKLRELRRNDAVKTLLVGSRFMREELLQNGFTDGQIQLLPPVVRFEDVEPTPLPQAPHILYVGQLIRGKGVDLLLQALAGLTVPFTATVVGVGNARAALETQCTALGLADRVRFTGWVPHAVLRPFYDSAKIVAVPSRWPEPFGMIGLEAMRHGRPVVGFAVGGIPDWLAHEQTGLLVPEQDIPAFTAALERLLTDATTAATYGKNGAARAKAEFGFQSYLDRLERYLGLQS